MEGETDVVDEAGDVVIDVDVADVIDVDDVVDVVDVVEMQVVGMLRVAATDWLSLVLRRLW